MIKYLTDIWILEKEGLVMFCKPNPPSVDEQCFGGLIRALYSINKNEFNETMHKYITDKHQYHILERHNVLFVGRFPQSKLLKDSQALHELKKIIKKLNLLPTQLKNLTIVL